MLQIIAIHSNKTIKSETSTLRFDVDKLEFYMKMYAPENYAEIDYDVKGNLLQVPLENEGHLIGNFSKYAKAPNTKYFI